MSINFLQGDCLEVLADFPPKSFQMTLTSPPYEDARSYGEVQFNLKRQGWVNWMLPRVRQMCRVTSGLVFIVMSGKVRKHMYSPVVEWLVADLTRYSSVVCGPAPFCYKRSGIPGSGGKLYQRRDWEPVYAFAEADHLPIIWADNTVMGHPPKYPRGGAMSNRKQDGSRVDDGKRPLPKLANPGNVVSCAVGGGKLGSKLAHETEAPFPEDLAEFFIRSYCPPGGMVLDPMCGSGTTLAVAKRFGRAGLGIDVRESQIELSRRRLREVPDG